MALLQAQQQIPRDVAHRRAGPGHARPASAGASGVAQDFGRGEEDGGVLDRVGAEVGALGGGGGRWGLCVAAGRGADGGGFGVGGGVFGGIGGSGREDWG